MRYIVEPKALAVAVLHILWGKADPMFPQSDRAHPSWVVHVQQHPGQVGQGYEVYFPMQVEGFLWADVIVPVLQDDSLSPSVSLNVSRVGQRDPTLLSQIEELVRAKMVETGYLPESTV